MLFCKLIIDYKITIIGHILTQPIHRFLLILAVMFFFIGAHVVLPSPGSGGGLYRTSNIATWMFMCVFISITMANIIENRRFVFNQTLALVGIGCLFLVIPIFYPHADVKGSILGVFGLIIGYLFLVALYQYKFREKLKDTLLLLIVLACAVEASIGLIQHYILTPFEIDWLYFRPEFSAPYMERHQGERSYGAFLHPNVMASFMATGVILSLYVLFKLKDLPIAKKSYIKMGLYYTAASCLHVLILMQSKAGYLGVLLGLIFLLPLLLKNRHMYKQPALLLLLSLTAAIVTLNLSENQRGEKIYTDKGVRSTIFYVTAKMILDDPIKGVGFGHFEKSYILKHYSELEAENIDSLPVANLSHPHNETLLWLVEGGISSALGLLCILIAGGLLIFKNDSLRWAKLSLLMPILLHSQVELPFVKSSLHFLVVLSLVFYLDNGKALKEYTIRHVNLLQPVLFSFFLTSFAYLLSAIHTQLMVNNYKAELDPSYLDKVINPHPWYLYIETERARIDLYTAVNNKDEVKLRNFINWAYKHLETEPRERMYVYLIAGLGYLQDWQADVSDIEIANAIADAKAVYPQYPHFEEKINIHSLD
ncbi:Wzy polymerase domain-containing protein [Thalassotalea aquiviva]|uniref:PglL family O-oligosaccharyltransferase n=1 Tax=Thalassotalea aquiviva TaxID=3242415 RepID=UPI00352A903D